MFRLPPQDGARARALFQPLDYHLAVWSVLNQRVPGQVYVDDLAAPQLALAWWRHRCFLAGRAQTDAAQAELRRLVSDIILPAEQAAGSPLLMLYCAPESEAEAGALAGVLPIRGDRQYYEFRALRHDWRQLLPEDMRLRAVDEALLQATHIGHLDRLREEMCSERESLAAFLSASFGVCLVRGDELVGWCLSEYNLGDRCELGIEVREPYQRRGLATLMASALIEQGLASGMRRFGWHCWTRNTASGATARAVGFALAQEYAVRLWWRAAG